MTKIDLARYAVRTLYQRVLMTKTMEDRAQRMVKSHTKAQLLDLYGRANEARASVAIRRMR